jgi:hypothetical protein
MRLLQTIRRPRTWSDWARTYLHVFRAVVVTVCLAVAAFAWLTHIEWLLAASVCIGVGELLESSYYLVVLDWGERRRGGTTTRSV